MTVTYPPDLTKDEWTELETMLYSDEPKWVKWRNDCNKLAYMSKFNADQMRSFY